MNLYNMKIKPKINTLIIVLGIIVALISGNVALAAAGDPCTAQSGARGTFNTAGTCIVSSGSGQTAGTPTGSATGGLKVAFTIVAIILPVAALFMVPKTLKWTTSAMGAMGGMMNSVLNGGNKAGRAAKSAGKQGYKSGKEGAQNKAAENQDKIAKKFGGGKAGERVALALGGGGMVGSLLGTQAARKKVDARAQGELSKKEGFANSSYAQYKRDLALHEAELRRNRAAHLMSTGMSDADAERSANAWVADGADGAVNEFRQRRFAEMLERTGADKDRGSQIAMQKVLAQSSDIDNLGTLRDKMDAGTWDEGAVYNYSAFDKIGPWRSYTESGRADAVSKMKYNDLVDTSGKGQAAIADDDALFESLNKKVIVDASADVTLRSKLEPKIIERSIDWANDIGSGRIPSTDIEKQQAIKILQRVEYETDTTGPRPKTVFTGWKDSTPSPPPVGPAPPPNIGSPGGP